MELVVDAMLFLGGLFLGGWWFSVIFLPILYGLPKALYWVASGRIRWRTPFLYLIAPALWTVVGFGVAVFFTLLFRGSPNYNRYLWMFSFSQQLGTGLVALRLLALRSARKDAREDFENFVRPYLK